MASASHPDPGSNPIQAPLSCIDHSVEEHSPAPDATSVLTEDEWNERRHRYLILERLSQLENEIYELKKYQSSYYEKDKESAVLRLKLRQATAGKEALRRLPCHRRSLGRPGDIPHR